MRTPLISQLINHGQEISCDFSPSMMNWLLGRDQAPSPIDFLKSIDFELLTQFHDHCITPLMFWKITQQGMAGEVSQSVLEWLQNDYELFLKTALLQEPELIKALKKLISVGVAPILLKGADFRLRLYGNPVARPMCDLDLLISPEELPRAQEILEGGGYTRAADSHCFRPGFRKRFMGELHLNSPTGRLMVDLHWYIEAVANFYRLPYQRLAHLAIPWEYEGMPVRLLCPEHALIHLCLHNYNELRNALQIIDLGLGLTRLPLDWSLFLKEAAFFRCQVPLGLMLGRLNQIFPQTVPETVLTSLSHYHPSGLEKLALSPALGKGFGPLVRLKHYHRLSDWAAYLAAIFWPHPDYLLAVFGKPDHVTYLRHTFKKYLT